MDYAKKPCICITSSRYYFSSMLTISLSKKTYPNEKRDIHLFGAICSFSLGKYEDAFNFVKWLFKEDTENKFLCSIFSVFIQKVENYNIYRNFISKMANRLFRMYFNTFSLESFDFKEERKQFGSAANWQYSLAKRVLRYLNKIFQFASTKAIPEPLNISVNEI